MKIVITCEHGGNQIPPEYKDLFKNYNSLLQSHEGWDIGALKLAQAFANALPSYFFYSETSRLLVELNRSLSNSKVFSMITATLSQQEKKKILEKYYQPYRNEVYDCISQIIEQGETVLHLSIHSFTPILNNKIRNTVFGFLYDPKRLLEKDLCALWKKEVYALSNEFKVRFNYPYLGKADGFTTFLRKNFTPEDYIGIEVEVNQKFLTDPSVYPKLESLLVSSLLRLLKNDSNLTL